jgi:hypothetical protein
LWFKKKQKIVMINMPKNDNNNTKISKMLLSPWFFSSPAKGNHLRASSCEPVVGKNPNQRVWHRQNAQHERFTNDCSDITGLSQRWLPNLIVVAFIAVSASGGRSVGSC